MFFYFHFFYYFSHPTTPTPIPGVRLVILEERPLLKPRKKENSPLASEMLTRVQRRTNVNTPVTTQGLTLFQPSKTYSSAACGKEKMAKRSKGFRSSDWSARCPEPADFTYSSTPNPCFPIRFAVLVLVSRTVKRPLNPSYTGYFFLFLSPSFVPIEEQ